ncbi:MAG: hypothetical protein HQM13_21910 [SAR324 cluster bacterium]|nr:hypothetical protein [SAR324 cluster bacterium]
MKKLVVYSCFFLLISGVLVGYQEYLGVLTGHDIMLVTHMWVGAFFIVLFPMFVLDHVGLHRKRLKKVSGISMTGLWMLGSTSGLIISGMVLWTHGDTPIYEWKLLHLLLTLVCYVGFALHFIVNRDYKGRRSK